MIKDRGNKKWTSLMLTEHRRALKKFKKSQQYKEKPELDGQKLEEMDYTLKKALALKVMVKIIYFENKDYKTFIGNIKKCLKEEKKIIFKEASGREKLLDMNNILQMEIIKKMI